MLKDFTIYETGDGVRITKNIKGYDPLELDNGFCFEIKKGTIAEVAWRSPKAIALKTNDSLVGIVDPSAVELVSRKKMHIGARPHSIGFDWEDWNTAGFLPPPSILPKMAGNPRIAAYIDSISPRDLIIAH